MVRVVNLNHARKARDRAQKRKQADDNAAFHGLSKAQKDLARLRSEKALRDHAGHVTAQDAPGGGVSDNAAQDAEEDRT